MNHRERALAAMRGEPVDHIPFNARMDIMYSDAEFEQFMEDLFHAVAPGERFILGFGDNVPTDALFPRIRRAVEFWIEHGAYPVLGL